MAQLAIKGHATRGKEVIEILEMLGGVNNKCLYGVTTGLYYFIDYGEICSCESVPDTYIIFTLEEFLEKFPYKVGDEVIAYAEKILAQFTIQDTRWNNKLNKVEYKICSSWLDTRLMQPVKKETVEESIKKTNKVIFDTNAQSCDIMNNVIKEETMKEKIKSLEILESHCANEVKIEFDPSKYEMIKRDNGYYVVKKQPKYPKTFIEVLSFWHPDRQIGDDYQRCYKKDLIEKFQDLLYARDAYWKIAGEQMGLGKPWNPNWCNEDKLKYCIDFSWNVANVKALSFACNNILAFPTEEIRNTFYENFKDLIEQCKELL